MFLLQKYTNENFNEIKLIKLLKYNVLENDWITLRKNTLIGHPEFIQCTIP